jgi:2-hydroxycyclohexanecarboxyl-CoA dehydrogenase
MTPPIAVVTGAASGIGLALARGLAADGYAVACADRDVNGAAAAVQDIRDSGRTAEAFIVDVSSSDSARELADAVGQRMGPAYALVNCAGWDDIKPFRDTDPQLWSAVIGVNLFGVVSMTHAFLDPLTLTGGRIINISSDAGRVGSSGETVYAAAKAGVIGFTKSVARELAREGVTANCVCPGPIDTPFLSKNSERVREALVRAIPMRRIGEPQDVVGAVLFFASAAASYVTGQVLSVSGGLTMNG